MILLRGSGASATLEAEQAEPHAGGLWPGGGGDSTHPSQMWSSCIPEEPLRQPTTWRTGSFSLKGHGGEGVAASPAAPAPSQHSGPVTPPPPSAHDDTQTPGKGPTKPALRRDRRKARLQSLAEALTHRFFTSCAATERGSPAPEESGCSPSKTIKAPGTALGLLGRRSWRLLGDKRLGLNPSPVTS